MEIEDLFACLDIEEPEDEPHIDFAAAVNDLVECVNKHYKPFVPPDYCIEPKFRVRPTSRKLLYQLVNRLYEAEVGPNGTIDVDLNLLRIQYHTLMVRKSYIDLARMLIEKEVGYRDYLVLGSPGTGKTVFCIFFMYVLLQANKRYGAKFPFIFNLRGKVGVYRNGLQVADRGFIDGGPDDHSMYVLYDDKPAPPLVYANATTIVFSSPNRQRYDEYQKGRCRKLFLPLWSKGELMRLMASIPEGFPEKLSEADLDERMLLSGGVPRRILEEWDSINDVINDGLYKINLNALNEGGMSCFESGPHSLIGIAVSSDYKRFRCRFLSKELRRKVFDNMKKNQQDVINGCPSWQQFRSSALNDIKTPSLPKQM